MNGCFLDWSDAAVGVIINLAMCVFCVKVYCVAQFCSPFPGNGRESERNGAERVTITIIFLKNKFEEHGEGETEGRPTLVLSSFGQTTTKSAHFYRLIQKD